MLDFDHVLTNAKAQGLDLVRVRHLGIAHIEGAYPPFLFKANLSQPFPRWMIEPRVAQHPHIWALACVFCGEIEGQPHGEGCPEAPPAPAPAEVRAAQERDTVPAGPAYPLDLAPADLVADCAQSLASEEPAPVAVAPPEDGSSLRWDEAPEMPEGAESPGIARAFVYPMDRKGLGTVEVTPATEEAQPQGRRSGPKGRRGA